MLDGRTKRQNRAIQIPEPKPAPDAFADEHYVGYYHLSFDLSELTTDLPSYLAKLKESFAVAAQNQPESLQPLKVLLEPTQQQIGDRIYEVAFIADADGLPLELIRVLGTLGSGNQESPISKNQSSASCHFIAFSVEYCFSVVLLRSQNPRSNTL